MSDAILRLYVAAKTYATTGDERGASLVEYALLVALVALAAISALILLGGNLDLRFNEIADNVGP